MSLTSRDLTMFFPFTALQEATLIGRTLSSVEKARRHASQRPLEQCRYELRRRLHHILFVSDTEASIALKLPKRTLRSRIHAGEIPGCVEHGKYFVNREFADSNSRQLLSDLAAAISLFHKLLDTPASSIEAAE